MPNKNVFKLWQSMDDHNETQVYGGLNESIDWSIFRNIADGKIPATDYKPVHLKLANNKILKKDFIQAPAGIYFISKKDWEINFKKAEVDVSLLSMYRKQLLISTNWLQKAEIHIGLTKRNAEAIFNERSAIKPIDFEHQDLQFECRINEYEWEKTLIAPYKDGLNLYIIVVNRTSLKTDEVYKKEALEVVKNIRFSYNLK